MATIFLLLVYVTFISLGLPDSLLGAAWPVMRTDFGAALDAAGAVSFVVTASTVTSSLISYKLVRRFGTAKVTAVSVLLTAVSLFLHARANSVWGLMLVSVPLGFGGGAVDSVLNNYISLYYKPRHMSWLHSFWGIGAFAGPVTMGLFLQNSANWRGGYRFIGAFQLFVGVLLFLALPMWKKQEKAQKSGLQALNAKEKPGENPGPKNAAKTQKGGGVLAIPGVIFAILSFFVYCSIEITIGVWGSSFLVESRGFAPPLAATAVAVYFGGITIGRFLTGFLTFKFTGKQLIWAGTVIVILSGTLLFLHLKPVYIVAALFLLGMGCAPIYPCMIHKTPASFGAENSQKIIGLQTAGAFAGCTAMAPLVGLALARFGTGLLPGFILLFAGALVCLFVKKPF